MDGLVFDLGFDPMTVEAMTVRQIHWWYRRAVAHRKRQAQRR